MKPLRLSALLMFVVLLTGACKKIPVIEVSNATITFKMDGLLKEAKGAKNVFALYSKEENAMQIIGNIAGNQIIGLTVADFHGVGEYTVDDGKFLGTYSIPEEILTVIGIEGKIKITEFIEGKSIKGEFQFKGIHLIISNDPEYEAPTSTFSEGKFDVKITAYSGPIVAPD